jgi:hypothetical protein
VRARHGTDAWPKKFACNGTAKRINIWYFSNGKDELIRGMLYIIFLFYNVDVAFLINF